MIKESEMEIKFEGGVPTYNILDDVAWDYIQINKENKILSIKLIFIFCPSLKEILFKNNYTKLLWI